MDEKVTENPPVQPLRRSARQASAKALSFVPTPRRPLIRSKRVIESRFPAGKINGTKESEDLSEAEEFVNKKRRMNPETAEGGRGDENMDEMESDDEEEWTAEQEMEALRGQGHTHLYPTHLLNSYQGSQERELRLYPHVALGDRCKTTQNLYEDASWAKCTDVKPPAKTPAAPIESSVRNRSGTAKHAAPAPQFRITEEYLQMMKCKAKSSESLGANYSVPGVHQASAMLNKPPSHVDNIPVQKQPARLPNQEGKSEIKLTNKETSGSFSSGLMWAFYGVFLLLLLGCAALMPNKVLPFLRSGVGGGGPQPSAIKAGKFAEGLSLLETAFPSQRREVWRRSRIHLEKHLVTEYPSEPVSLILTAGRNAQRTLYCLSRGLASSFSSASNASVLHIDGASMAGLNSDEVKLDIDNQLRSAFEGEKPVAVIHRLEELPPSSTLIFYRYCDHENAAYKKVFLLFTVLLPQDEVSQDQSLKEVEELVQDYVEERLVGSGSQAAFDQMDTDKYGGLWSRISHLILPVVSEQQVELNGC